MTERRLVRWMLFSVPFLCALQYVVYAKRGQPYPAVMGPSFGGSATADYQRLVPTLKVTRQTGDSVERSAYDLFADLPRSVNVSIVDKRLSYKKTLPAEAAEWVWERVIAIEPNAAAAVVSWSKGSQWLGNLSIK